MAPNEPGTDVLHADLLDLDGEGTTPVAPSGGLRASLFASITPATRLEGFATRLARFVDLDTAGALALLRHLDGVANTPWTPDQVPGVQLLHFAGGPARSGSDCGLVHLAPGQRYPLHLHRGDEWALVLSGSAEEEGTGTIWSPGDLVRRPAGSAHAFRALGAEPFVFAVVLRDGIELQPES